MNWWWKTWNSSIGMKTMMAVTGTALLLFVIGHMFGNLQIYLGQDALNTYAKKLQGLPVLLWPVRIGLLAIVLIHVISALRLTVLNRAARPVGYELQKAVQVSYASRTLLLSGGIIFAFVVYHVLHLTLGTVHSEFYGHHDAAGRHDVYRMVVLGFSQIPISAAYIVAMLLLGFHLGHGASSLFQSLGINHPKYQPFLEKLGPVLATLIVIGNISIPISILLGWIKLPGGA